MQTSSFTEPWGWMADVELGAPGAFTISHGSQSRVRRCICFVPRPRHPLSGPWSDANTAQAAVAEAAEARSATEGNSCSLVDASLNAAAVSERGEFVEAPSPPTGRSLSSPLRRQRASASTGSRMSNKVKSKESIVESRHVIQIQDQEYQVGLLHDQLLPAREKRNALQVTVDQQREALEDEEQRRTNAEARLARYGANPALQASAENAAARVGSMKEALNSEQEYLRIVVEEIASKEELLALLTGS